MELSRKQGCQMDCFQTKKSQFWKKFRGLRLENVDTFYGHMGYFMTIRSIFCSFGIEHNEKSGNPTREHQSRILSTKIEEKH
jgi:hypothetical protein